MSRPGQLAILDAVDASDRIVVVDVSDPTDGPEGTTKTVEVPDALGGYVPTSRAIGTNAPLTGGGALSGDLSLGITDATASFRGAMSAEDKAKLDGMRNHSRALFAKAGLTKPGTGSTTTTILDSDAWTEELDTHDYFTQSSNGRFKYTDATSRKFLVRVTGQVNKTVAVDSIRLLLFKSGVDVGTDSSSAVARVPLNDNWASVSFITTVTLETNDIVDIRARSGTSSNDIKANVTLELEEVVA